MYIYLNIYKYINRYLHIYTYIYVYLSIYIYTYTYIYIYIYIYNKKNRYMYMNFAKQTNTGRPPNFDSMCTPISQPVFSLFQNCDPFCFEISTPSKGSVPSFRRVGGRGAHGPRALGRGGAARSGACRTPRKRASEH